MGVAEKGIVVKHARGEIGFGRRAVTKRVVVIHDHSWAFLEVP